MIGTTTLPRAGSRESYDPKSLSTTSLVLVAGVGDPLPPQAQRSTTASNIAPAKRRPIGTTTPTLPIGRRTHTTLAMALQMRGPHRQVFEHSEERAKPPPCAPMVITLIRIVNC